MWQNSKTQILQPKKSNYENTEKNLNATKLKLKWNHDKTYELKLWLNSETKIVTIHAN